MTRPGVTRPGVTREAIVVVDLGYGDQGKGTVTDFVVRDRGAHTVVRYNGGAQAGHNVVTADGRHHTFAQFSAGMFVPGVQTFLTQHVAIQPWAMVVEAEHLRRAGVPDAFARTLIAEEALVITPWHRAANRLRERARGDRRHGSCGVGVGETVMDARSQGPDPVIRARDLLRPAALRAMLMGVQERKRTALADLCAALRDDPGARDDIACLDDPTITDVYLAHLAPFTLAARVVGEDALRAVLVRPGAVVFEGAQGVLLDEWRGFHPYTTWSTCTDANAAEVLSAHGYDGEVLHLGIVRAYATRHGAGPLVTEDPGLTARVPDPHNGTHPWQGRFRVGWFDAVATRYAIGVCDRIDALAVTCLDRLHGEPVWQMATRYQMAGGERVYDLAIGVHGDLDHQAALTEAVLGASALVEVTTDRGKIDAHVAAIAAETARPVAMVSRGPTAADKRWLGP